jgi:hypothetical protein
MANAHPRKGCALSERSWLSNAAIVVLAALALFAVTEGPHEFSVRSLRFTDAYRPFDFAIFYCAGTVLNAGGDPLRVEPLRTCERNVWPPGSLGGHAEPSAVPGYALPVFALLARLPFPVASDVWLAIYLLAFGAAVLAMTRLSGLHPLAPFGLLVALTRFDIQVGQLGVPALAAVALAAWCASTGRARSSGGFALAALLEPHIGIAAVIGAFCFVPRARLLVAAGVAAAAALHFAVLGPATGAEYFSSMLPALGRAELLAMDQYGTAWFLYHAGMPDRVALATSSAMLAAALVLGVLAARRAVNAAGDRAFGIAVPVAAALAFSPFMHDNELLPALVLPISLYPHAAEKWRWLSVTLIAANPWLQFTLYPLGHIALLVWSAVVTSIASRGGITRKLAAAAASLVLLAALALLLRRLPNGYEAVPLQATPPPGPNDLAAESWAAYIRAEKIAFGTATVLPKLIELGGIVASVIWASQLRPRREPRESAAR